MTDESQYISRELFERTVEKLMAAGPDPGCFYLPPGVTIDDLVQAELLRLWPEEYGRDAA